MLVFYPPLHRRCVGRLQYDKFYQGAVFLLQKQNHGLSQMHNNTQHRFVIPSMQENLKKN